VPQFGAPRIRVLGSAARGEERADSDIDFLMDFTPGYDLFTQRLPLAERLAEITGGVSPSSPSTKSTTICARPC